MAIDATGPATNPDLIPTYNTPTDAPSGKGLNAIVAALQTALSKRVLLQNPADGDVPVYDIASGLWKRSGTDAKKIGYSSLAIPKVTTSTFAGGPPGSPTDGDIWIATDPFVQAGVGGVAAERQRWEFIYDAGHSSDAYKWKSLGVLPYTPGIAQGTTSATSAIVSTTTPLTTTPTRAGVYYVRNQFVGSAPGVGTLTTYFFYNAVQQAAQQMAAGAAGAYSWVFPWMGLVLATPSQTAEFKYASNIAFTGSTFAWEWQPIRVI